METLAKLHEAWGPAASSPHATLTIKEVAHSGSTVTLRLFAQGLPKDGSYALLGWPVTQKMPTEVLKGITLDASGMAICAGRPGTCGKPEKPDDPIDLMLTPIAGEPVRLALVAADGKTKAFAKLVPIPLTGVNEGCTVNATLLTPGGELLLVEGSGFEPKSEVRMTGNSEGEIHSKRANADAAGHYVTAILPFKEGLAHGTIQIQLKSAQCAPAVKVDWGRPK